MKQRNSGLQSARPIDALGLVLLLLGCDVDDRKLTPICWNVTNDTEDSTSSSGGASGVSSQGIQQAGRAPTIVAGSASTVDAQASVPSACNDLDQNARADYTESLVENPDFSDDSTAWEPQVGASVVWNQTDACSLASSGSLNVTYRPVDPTTGWAGGAAVQCAYAVGGATYLAMAAIYMPSAGSRGRIGMEFFTSTDCSKGSLGTSESPILFYTGSWTPSSVASVAPLTAHSVSVRLIAGRVDWETTRAQADVCFDGVLLKTVP